MLGKLDPLFLYRFILHKSLSSLFFSSNVSCCPIPPPPPPKNRVNVRVIVLLKKEKKKEAFMETFILQSQTVEICLSTSFVN